jgi:hypothetical protein
VHAISHCGTQPLPSPPSGAPSRLWVVALTGSPGPSDHPEIKQLRPGPQSELLWQGSDTHALADPPSAARPGVGSHAYPFGQSDATEHARACACRGDEVIEANAQKVRIP